MIRHPAKYSDILLPYFDNILPSGNCKILDPFAGTGKLRNIRPHCFLLEIEPEWAYINKAIVGDATEMPFGDCVFDSICTSPTYGNRMADSFEDKQPHKEYKRNTYRHALNRPLSPNNSGAMQWGNRYKTLHISAWKECYRVLKEGGLMILNISDHIRKGKVVRVTDWHLSSLRSIGFTLNEHINVETKRQRYGRNGNLRVPYESILIFEKGVT